nr:AtpZ/AtpI family protein [Desulforadius tongensis]
MKKGSPLQALAITTTIGMELAITSVLGFYGGRYIDHRLDTAPVFLIIGLLAGLAVGVMGIINTLNAFFKDKQDKGVK